MHSLETIVALNEKNHKEWEEKQQEEKREMTPYEALGILTDPTFVEGTTPEQLYEAACLIYNDDVLVGTVPGSIARTAAWVINTWEENEF